MAVNNPKIQALVDEINQLIARDTESDGVIDKTNTWEEPYIYEPIVYRNGKLIIVSYSPYSSHKKDTEIIKAADMASEGIPTLRNIRKMYTAMLKKGSRYSMDERKSFKNSTLLENYIRIGGRKLNEEAEQYRADVAGVREDSWSNNGVTYNTPEEAKKWLDNLADRWFGFDMSRVVPASTPTREKIDPNDPTIYQNFRK